MKLKRLAAATMGFMMVFAVPAYANDADAVAVYQEMNEKQKTLSDVNAYYDFNMRRGESLWRFRDNETGGCGNPDSKKRCFTVFTK